MNNLIKFQDKQLKVTTIEGKPCFTSVELAIALGYSREDKVSRIFDRHKDEFSEDMTVIISENPKSGVSGNLQTKTRYFSPRGCHLIAMFARTPFAKEFRKWVLDVLEQYQTGIKVPVRPYKRSLPSVKKEIVLSETEHKAIGGIVKKCVAVAVKDTLGSIFSTQGQPVIELKPMESLTNSERKLAEAMFKYGAECERKGKIMGMLEGAMNPRLVEVMQNAERV